MKISGIDFPIEMLKHLRAGELVIFAGAGVSMGAPACLPNFKGLAKEIAEGTGETRDEHEPEDRFLGWLQHKGVHVHERAAQVLSGQGKVPPAPTKLHFDLLRLYPEPESLRVVTTNFDLLFEHAATRVFEAQPTVYRAPLLPLGGEFRGIVHLHGDVNRPDSMVVTDMDFGRAYMTESWARRFLAGLFSSRPVLFIGYSHSDVVMNYLTRALQDSAQKRYVLAPSDENEETLQKWQVLGIQRIEYPKSPHDDFRGLRACLSGLAEFARRQPNDWKRLIAEIAARPPSNNGEKIDLVNFAFLDPELTKNFTSADTPPEWIEWFAERDDIGELFKTDRDHALGERDEYLARWLAEKFACQHADQLFHLIGQHGMRLHPNLWFELVREINKETDMLVESETLSRWVSILASTPPPLSDNHVFGWLEWEQLGERCMEAGLTDSCIDIFELMADNRLELNKSTGNLRPVCDHATINDLWEKALKPNIETTAEPLLARIVELLEKRHRVLHTWRSASRTNDPIMFHRDSITPPEENLYLKPFDVLIDAARDCLVHLLEHSQESAASWCERLTRADPPHLRKLAVYALCARNDMSESEKIDWFLRRHEIHDLPTENETLPFLQCAYPLATPQQRKAIIEAILAYSWPDEDDELKEWQTEHERFKWLNWLHQSDPQCNLAKQSLDKIGSDNPDLLPRETPGAFPWSEEEWDGHQSPWGVEELLSRPAAEWAAELLSFRQIDGFGPDRDGLRDAVKEAAAQNFDWSLQLADTLVENGEWQTDLWLSLIGSWCRDLKNEAQRRVLGYLNQPELHALRARSVVEALTAVTGNGDVPCTPQILSEANQIARKLKGHFDVRDLIPVKGDWLTQAINDMPGRLAQYWLTSVDVWRRLQEEIPKRMSDEYRAALTEIVVDGTRAGTLGKAILASWSPYLLEADEEWTKRNLLPLFGHADDLEAYQAVWDGFLDARKTKCLCALLKDSFLVAISRIETHLPGEERRQYFVRDFTLMLAYIVRDPTEILNGWLPTFFAHSAEDEKVLFGQELESRLEEMDDTDQQELWNRWLLRYLQNRLQGVPAPLCPGEIGAILDWLPHFKSLFPDAVELAVTMPPQEIDRSFALYQIKQETLWETYPESVAALLAFLDKCTIPPNVWHFHAKEVIAKLLGTNLADDTKKNLLSISVRRGLDF